MQSITIASGYALKIVVSASQAPLGQRWRIAAWGQRDGVQQPIPPGWTPPNGGGPWQLVYSNQTNFGDPPPTYLELNWPAYGHQLTLTYEGWANRGGQQDSWDEIKESDNNHFLVAFDRVQDDPALDHSGHYADMSIDTTFSPPLA
jgi:hypothetical protein